MASNDSTPPPGEGRQPGPPRVWQAVGQALDELGPGAVVADVRAWLEKRYPGLMGSAGARSSRVRGEPTGQP